MREGLHFGGAGACVLGLGYGFIQPNSTRLALKSFYFGTLGMLALSIKLGALEAEADEFGYTGKDPQSGFKSRAMLMGAEYLMFLSGAVAIAFPKVRKG